MNLDSDVASMASLIQIIMHDMKALPGAFDVVHNKALKLSVQINTMLTAFNGFIEAVQSISDLANNLKGASRDIGASLTRFSMRQRGVEEYFRQLAKSLSDQFGAVVNHDRRRADVKQVLHDLDRRHQKVAKKRRHVSKKNSTEEFRDAEILEYREICTELLRAQRSQFLWFNSLLVPVLNAQLTLFEEATNVRQVRDALELSRDAVTDNVITNLLDDLSLHSSFADGSAWHQRLGSPTRRSSQQTPSPTSSLATWNTTVSDAVDIYARPHTISAAAMGDGPKRASITQFNYGPVATAGKPPLPRAPSAPQGIAGVVCNNSTLNPPQACSGPQRPMSLNGQEAIDGSGMTTPSNDKEFLETLKEIRKLGAELNSYDVYTQPQHLQQAQMAAAQGYVQYRPMINMDLNASMLSVASVDSTLRGGGTVRIRNGHCNQGPPCSYRPPPPERRNSTIQAASTAAPSIADIRSAISSTNNSRTSSTQDLSMPLPPPPFYR
ncbi:hypothetical protein L596_029001 [Steinernema carpocapsae]|uniref:IMD domain-containing protein n=1 Tax=Steinernema carpocapsae TaxID=34508 RepID=A0A4U5LTC2_STECR|nr:hypothetical protein L596_029001 [Steinernema carpocapsae]